MKIRRRDFIKTAGGLALATVAHSLPVLPDPQVQPRGKKIRIALFYEPSFPSADGIAVDRQTLQDAINDFDSEFLGVDQITKRLSTANFDLFLNPYGSTFPEQAFDRISGFLADGGNWVNLGGVPFSVPVDRAADGWRVGPPQTSYHQRLGITQSFTVSAGPVSAYQPNPELEWTRPLVDQFKAMEVYELYVRFTSVKDFPNEDGSPGPRDAVLTPLVHGVTKEHQRIVAPMIEIDRLQGPYSGGRWVLANFKGTITARAIRLLVERGAQGAMQFIVRPSFASYYPGEQPSFTVQFRRPKMEVEDLVRTGCRLAVFDEQGRAVWQVDVPLLGSGALATGDAHMTGQEKLRPGLYQVNAALGAQLKSFHVLRHRTGFWIYDDALIKRGKAITAGNGYLLRDDKTFPVTGTTYMASDVHRKFLFEPNPYVWNKDFAEMKAAGVNMIRTGIWTGWKQYMPDVGAPNEAALRAMDAFVLTARKFDIPIIFTLFAFLPESWGGANPYLDPQSVNAQKEFVTAFAHRYRHMNDIIWDLINEPSFCNPQYLWQCRPNYDRYETEAWQVWLKKRYADFSDEATTARILEAHRSTAGEAISLPTKEDFEDVNVFESRRPVKTIDYRLFAQDMFMRWVNEIKGAIRGVQGHASQLITVGQDEGGTYDSPANQFFGNSVDFTCVHNWWLNDDLLWDQIVTTIPGKPNLVEETGVMLYEKMDATPWRTEVEARNLLERKMALALGAGGAGFIQWLWNTNPYMPSDNEAAIGFHRADGTAKPELEPMMRLARFIAAHRDLMHGRKDEDALMVIPHSQMFSTRNFATEATRRCVRVMNEHFSAPLAAVSEYRPVSRPPRLLIMPSPRTINQKCWETLLSSAESGSTVLLTGIIDADDHWLPVERSKSLGVEAIGKPVAEEEFLRIGEIEYRLSYRGEKIQRVEKAVVRRDEKPAVITIPHGSGKLIWCPLPVELSETVEPTVELYRYALRQAGIAPVCNVEPVNSGVIVIPAIFEDTVLYTLISECDRDTDILVTHLELKTELKISVPAQRIAMTFIDRRSGKVLGKM